MLKFITKIFFFVSLLFAFNQAIAAHVVSLYDVDVLVVDESASSRLSAFKQGLDEVFVRISGDSIVMDKLKRPAAATFVKQYSYDPVDEPATNKNGQQLTHRIKIHYNGRAMGKYLLDNGFPVWSAHRPDVVIWLAVRDGRNEYVLKEKDKSLLKAAADDALIRRGVSRRWPLYDAKDRKLLSVADIRGGFKEPVTNASKRYSRGPALTGSIIWNGKKWQSSWSLLMKSENRYWSLENKDYNVLINKAIDQAADALGVVFAIRGSVGKQQMVTVQLAVQSVNSIEKYHRVESYLTGLNAVQSAKILQVDGLNVLFEATLRSDEDDFLNLIENDAELIKVDPPAENKPSPGIHHSSAELEIDIEQPVEKTAGESEKAGLESEKAGVESGKAVVESEKAGVESDDELLAKQQNPVPVYYYRLIN